MKRQDWIPVTERLPENGENVLIQVNGKPQKNITLENAYELASYSMKEGWILEEYPDWENPNVIAWMQLPELYKEEKHGSNN